MSFQNARLEIWQVTKLSLRNSCIRLFAVVQIDFDLDDFVGLLREEGGEWGLDRCGLVVVPCRVVRVLRRLAHLPAALLGLDVVGEALVQQGVPLCTHVVRAETSL